jgi:hypothetical protein
MQNVKFRRRRRRRRQRSIRWGRRISTKQEAGLDACGSDANFARTAIARTGRTSVVEFVKSTSPVCRRSTRVVRRVAFASSPRVVSSLQSTRRVRSAPAVDQTTRHLASSSSSSPVVAVARTNHGPHASATAVTACRPLDAFSGRTAGVAWCISRHPRARPRGGGSRDRIRRRTVPCPRSRVRLGACGALLGGV